MGTKLFGFVVTLCVLAGASWAQEAARTISVSGVGSVAAAPDMAEVRVGVETRARSARDALRANSDAMAALFATLAAAGIAERDMQTTSLSLYPEFDQRSGSGQPGVSGYVASNGIYLRIRAVAETGRILDELSASGANSIQSVSFSVADPSELQDAARRAAVADARRKAEIYAAEAGVTLGPLVAISEGGGVAPFGGAPEVMMERSFDAAVPVAAGETTITAQISAVWRIAE